MSTGRPLFCGNSDQDQLTRIFRVLGVPSRDDWPGLLDLPEGRNVENNMRHLGPPKGLHTVLPRLSKDPVAMDLLQKMLQYDPSERISARDAMRHPYFRELDANNVAQSPSQ